MFHTADSLSSVNKIDRISLCLVIIMIFISDDSLSMNVFGQNSFLLKQIIYILTIAILVINNKSYNLTRIKNSSQMLMLLIIIFLTSFINLDFTYGYLVQILALFTGYLFARKISFQTFAYTYTKILFYVALLSLIIFSIFLLMPNFIDLIPLSINSGEAFYVNLFFYVHFIDMFRNTGIFREPGVYMIYLNIGILIEFFARERPSRKHVVIYILSILTTLSTAGFIILGIILLVYVLNNRSAKTMAKVTFFAIVLIAFLFYNYEIFETTLTKFQSDQTGMSKALARTSSVTVPFNIFMINPYFGTGLTDFTELYKSISFNLYGVRLEPGGESTNTFINLLATYGVLLGCIIVFGYYKLTSFFAKSIIIRLLIFISFIFMLSNEDIRYSILFSTLLFYGLTYRTTNKF